MADVVSGGVDFVVVAGFGVIGGSGWISRLLGEEGFGCVKKLVVRYEGAVQMRVTTVWIKVDILK